MTDAAATGARYLEKAGRAFDEARYLLADKRAEGACSRAYYAMFDAAHAALFVTGNETPETLIKTHRGLIAEFGRRLVMSGEIAAGHGRALNEAGNMRLIADYDAEVPGIADAAWAVREAGEFVAAIRNRFFPV